MNLTNEDVEKEIHMLPPVIAKKSDGLSCALIKKFKGELLEPLTIMFKRSIQNGEVLEIPFSIVVVPLLKAELPQMIQSPIEAFRFVVL